MKITGKMQGITLKKLFIVLGVSLAITVPIRMYQLFSIIDDRSTGFYDVIDWSVYTLYALLAVFLVLLIVLPTLSGRITASRPVIMQHKAMGIGSFILAAGIAYDIVFMLITLIRSMQAYSSQLGINVLQYIFANGLFAIALEAVCGLLASIYLILFGLSYIDGKTTFREYKLLAIMPLFWAMFRMVFRFMTKISFTRVSDLLFELFMLGLMMLFFMSFARISAQMAGKGEMRRLVKYGLPAAMLAFLIGITRFIVVIGGRGELLPDQIGFSLADPAFGVFAVIYMSVHLKYGRPASEDDLLKTAEREDAEKNAADDHFLSE